MFALKPEARAAARESSRIAYIHIPKTGGVSMMASLKAANVSTCNAGTALELPLDGSIWPEALDRPCGCHSIGPTCVAASDAAVAEEPHAEMRDWLAQANWTRSTSVWAATVRRPRDWFYSAVGQWCRNGRDGSPVPEEADNGAQPECLADANISTLLDNGWFRGPDCPGRVKYYFKDPSLQSQMLDGVFGEPNWVLCSIEAREEMYAVLDGLLADQPMLQDAHVIEGAWSKLDDFRRSVPWEAVKSFYEADDALYARVAAAGCIGRGQGKIGEILRENGVKLQSSEDVDALAKTVQRWQQNGTRPDANDPAGDIYLLHIPKTAVTSALKDFHALPGYSTRGDPVFGIRFQQQQPVRIVTSEGCFGRGDELGLPVATFLREPRAHVVSQYYHCRLSEDHEYGWGSMPGTIDEWVASWAQSTPKDREALAVAPTCYHAGVPDPYCCYIPWNQQTQRLTCTEMPGLAHPALTWTGDARIDNSSTWPVDGARVAPQLNETLALANVRRARFIGLVEAYQESLCLFAATTAGVGALPAWCDCEDQEAWGRFVSMDDTHGNYTHPPPDALPAEVLEQIDEMTAKDRMVYEAMVGRFMQDVASVERTSGQRILCDAAKRRLATRLGRRSVPRRTSSRSSAKQPDRRTEDVATARAPQSATSLAPGRGAEAREPTSGELVLCYAARYPEVAAAFGNDSDALLRHWRQFGTGPESLLPKDVAFGAPCRPSGRSTRENTHTGIKRRRTP